MFSLVVFILSLLFGYGQDFNAKLSDFGLATMGPEGSNTHVTTRVMGTYGYAAPEYVNTGKLLIIHKSRIQTYYVLEISNYK